MRSGSAFPDRPALDDKPIYELLWHGRALPVVALAMELGVLDWLAERPATVRELAAWLVVEDRAAEAMLAVLAASGFLIRNAEGRLEPTELTRTYLLSESPLRYPYLVMPEHEGLSQLRAVFRSGGNAAEATMADMPGQSIEEVSPFIADMHRITLPAAAGLGQHPAFKGITRLLDVAGGSGSLSAGIAARNPGIRCTLLDLPAVCEIARKNIELHGLAGQVTAVPGDMFEDGWPHGHDGILFGNIFHDWEPARCMDLARRAFEALEPGGSILLHEMLLNETRDGPLLVACFSINMLLYEHGKQYTLSELRSFLEEAGFIEVEASASFGYYSLVTARKPAN